MAKDLDFQKAFTYPFHRWQGLLNILWVLVPIYGWFLIIGYRVRILSEFLQGRYEKLPKIKHGGDFVLGWKMFWKGLPGILVIVAASLLLGFLEEVGMFLFVILVLLVVPVLSLNFIRKRTVDSYFELNLVQVVAKNIGDYLVALLKEIALAMIFLVMIVVLVGLPAGVFSKGIFFADFYRRHVRAR